MQGAKIVVAVLLLFAIVGLAVTAHLNQAEDVRVEYEISNADAGLDHVRVNDGRPEAELAEYVCDCDRCMARTRIADASPLCECPAHAQATYQSYERVINILRECGGDQTSPARGIPARNNRPVTVGDGRFTGAPA